MAVYMIQAGEGGAVKIGFSANPKSRLSKMRTDLPHHLIVLRLLQGDMTTERALHKRFSEHRIRGEWFRFDPEMMLDLGIPVYVPPPRERGFNAINPLTGKVGREWTAEERAACAARQLAISADPAKREARRAKLRATFARKAADRISLRMVSA